MTIEGPSRSLIIAWLPILLVSLWFIYRIIRGWMALNSGQPMYS